jgi:hypothetical protein
MGKYFELTLQVPQYQAGAATVKRREQTAADASVHLQAWHGIMMIAAVGLVAFYYLILANSGATASYRITMMQSDMSSMIQQQKKLETQRAELQSMQSIQSNPTVTAMVPVTSVTYLAQ